MNSNILLLLVAALVFSGCSGDRDNSTSEEAGTATNDHESAMETGMGDHSHHQSLENESDPPSDESIYHSETVWQNRHGDPVSLKDFRGKTQVVTMVYTYCEYACPRIVADMKRIERDLSAEDLQNTNFVIISIDPERDVPERLATFADENNLDEENWTLLNGEEWDVLEVAALLGVRYKRISDTDFSHSNMISVLNREGEVVYQRKELADSQQGIIRAIENL